VFWTYQKRFLKFNLESGNLVCDTNFSLPNILSTYWKPIHEACNLKNIFTISPDINFLKRKHQLQDGRVMVIGAPNFAFDLCIFIDSGEVQVAEGLLTGHVTSFQQKEKFQTFKHFSSHLVIASNGEDDVIFDFLNWSEYSF